MESLWPVCFTASDHVSCARPDDGVTHVLFVYYVLCAVRWSRGLQLGRATTSRASCNNPAPKFDVFPSGRHQAMLRRKLACALHPLAVYPAAKSASRPGTLLIPKVMPGLCCFHRVTLLSPKLVAVATAQRRSAICSADQRYERLPPVCMRFQLSAHHRCLNVPQHTRFQNLHCMYFMPAIHCKNQTTAGAWLD